MLVTEFSPNMTFFNRPPAIGRVFYVKHYDGANTNTGVKPGSPLKTIKYALTQCLADRNDYIIVLDCWADPDEDFPIIVNKSRVHIIGLSIPSMNLFPQLQGGGSDIFQLNANYVEIAGFGFVSIGKSGIISGAGAPSYGWIHHCTFATAALSLLNGIELSGGQMGNMLIEDNFFGANITNDGITGQLVNSIIRNNVFRSIAAICLNLGGVEIGAIYGNLFFHALALTPAIGWAITLAAGANGGLIMRNHASQSIDNAGKNPYRDVDGVNGWSENWTGNALINPNIG